MQILATYTIYKFYELILNEIATDFTVWISEAYFQKY